MFEGSEKKVEIMLTDGPSLRPLRAEWERVVAAAKATILSTVSNDHMDAYLLSESSLFVYDRAALMITCGTISLALAVEEMCTFIPRDQIRMMMYERKNEYFPEKQLSQFDDDVARLSKIFPGEVANLGSLGGHHVRLFHHAADGFTPPQGDMTVELLMHDLSPAARALFAEPGLTRESLYARTGIHQLLPDVVCDDFLFDPMGYSLNAIGGNDYYTIHVTPEDICSYASFETNHRFGDNLEQVVARVLAIFEPANFSMVLFKQDQPPLANLDHYVGREVVDSTYRGYHVRFRNFARI